MTIQSLYIQYKNGEVTDSKFLYEVRKKNYPFLHPNNSLKDIVSILKRQKMIFEVKEKNPELPKVEVETIDMVSPYEYAKGMNYELGLTNKSAGQNTPTVDETSKAQKKVLRNLTKDPYWYTRKMMTDEEKKTEKANEREYEIKKQLVHNNKKGIIRENKLEELDINTYADQMDSTSDYGWTTYLSNDKDKYDNPRHKGNKQKRVNKLSREGFEKQFYSKYPKNNTTLFSNKGKAVFIGISFNTNYTNYNLNFKLIDDKYGSSFTITNDKGSSLGYYIKNNNNLGLEFDDSSSKKIKDMLKYNTNIRGKIQESKYIDDPELWNKIERRNIQSAIERLGFTQEDLLHPEAWEQIQDEIDFNSEMNESIPSDELYSVRENECGCDHINEDSEIDRININIKDVASQLVKEWGLSEADLEDEDIMSELHEECNTRYKQKLNEMEDDDKGTIETDDEMKARQLSQQGINVKLRDDR